jgi:hypothetical protein
MDQGMTALSIYAEDGIPLVYNICAHRVPYLWHVHVFKVIDFVAWSSH